ncbi:group III truncated hemoglobin [Hydrotalea sp.]|uniref:group III truncated hemoglobin n=1 Tax=Hydrotalea sp. TaxID=2881279 RepID=UPI003D0B519C
MITKNDITNRDDLLALMEAFYAKALKDELIQHFFNEVAHLNLKTHLPIIVNFWESVLFETATYKGNAMAVHQHLHQLSPFKQVHFNRWVSLFQQTVDELFAGENAEKIKQRAQSIATIMALKTIYKNA